MAENVTCQHTITVSYSTVRSECFARSAGSPRGDDVLLEPPSEALVVSLEVLSLCCVFRFLFRRALLSVSHFHFLRMASSSVSSSLDDEMGTIRGMADGGSEACRRWASLWRAAAAAGDVSESCCHRLISSLSVGMPDDVLWPAVGGGDGGGVRLPLLLGRPARSVSPRSTPIHGTLLRRFLYVTVLSMPRSATFLAADDLRIFLCFCMCSLLVSISTISRRLRWSSGSSGLDPGGVGCSSTTFGASHPNRFPVQRRNPETGAA